jgi:hypothetical protein
MADQNTLQPPEGFIKEGQTTVTASEVPEEEKRGEGWIYETKPKERNAGADALTGAAVGVASKVVNPITTKVINKVADIASGPIPAGAKPSVYRAAPSNPTMNWVKQMHNVADYSPAYEAAHYKDAHQKMMAAEEARKKAEKLQKLENLFKSEEQIRKAATPVKDTIRAASSAMTPVGESMLGKAASLGMQTLGRGIAGGSAAYQGVDAYNRLKRGDYAGAAIGGLGALGSAAALIPTPATRVVGTALGLGGELGTLALDKYRKKNQPGMADGGPVQHFFNGGLISPLVSVVQPQASSDTTSGSLVPAAAEPVAVAEPGKPIAPAVQPVQAFSGELPGAVSTLENQMAVPLDTKTAPVALESGMLNDMPMMTATGNNQNNVGAGSVMPTIRQYTPQRPQQTVAPRRTQQGGMPTYMQNNRAYEAQRQARTPYTVFPPANQLLPQGRVTPRRGVPVARMAEGGPVKKK